MKKDSSIRSGLFLCGRGLETHEAAPHGFEGLGSGTLYTLLEQFLDAGMIRETKVEGRKRSYILTEKGNDILEKECQRLEAQLADYYKITGRGMHNE